MLAYEYVVSGKVASIVDSRRVGTNEYPYSCRSVRQNEALETLERQRRPHQGLFFFALPWLFP